MPLLRRRSRRLLPPRGDRSGEGWEEEVLWFRVMHLSLSEFNSVQEYLHTYLFAAIHGLGGSCQTGPSLNSPFREAVSIRTQLQILVSWARVF